jgi:hypothetical protein
LKQKTIKEKLITLRKSSYKWVGTST